MHICIQNTKIYPMKEFRTIFSISLISVIRSAYAKQGQFTVLAIFQNVWDLHKFVLQICIQNAKITLWKNFGQFFQFHRPWSSGPRMQNKVFFNISCISKCMGFTIIWDADLNSERKNYSIKEFRPIFPISSIFVIRSAYCETRSFLNISCFKIYGIYINLGCRFEFRMQKLQYETIFGNFFRLHRFRSSGPRLWNKIISQY